MDISCVDRRTIAPGLPSTLIELPWGNRETGGPPLLLHPSDEREGRFWLTLFTSNPLPHSIHRNSSGFWRGTDVGEFMFQFTKYIRNARCVFLFPEGWWRRDSRKGVSKMFFFFFFLFGMKFNVECQINIFLIESWWVRIFSILNHESFFLSINYHSVFLNTIIEER